MSYYEDRHEELKEIKDTLTSLIGNIYDKEYISTFQDIVDEVEEELDEVNEELGKIEKAEERELQREYDTMRL